MSNQAPNWFKEEYRDNVTHVYQAKGFLYSGTVMPAGTIDGTKAYWHVSGKGSARKKVRNQAAVPMNPSRGRVEAVLETWEAFDEVHTYDVSRMGPDEKMAIAESGAKALGRAVDQEIVDNMNANAATSGNRLVGDGTGAFGLVAAIQMVQRLQAEDVPMDGQIYCPLPSLYWNLLMTFKQFTSSDYVGPDLPLKQMTTVKTWNHVNWFLAPDSYFPVPSFNQFDIFMYHKQAVGWANNETLRTIWDWDNRMGCHTVRMESEGAALTLLPEGIVRGRFASNTAITLPA